VRSRSCAVKRRLQRFEQQIGHDSLGIRFGKLLGKVLIIFWAYEILLFQMQLNTHADGQLDEFLHIVWVRSGMHAVETWHTQALVSDWQQAGLPAA
jgi:hypothetical protein